MQTKQLNDQSNKKATEKWLLTVGARLSTPIVGDVGYGVPVLTVPAARNLFMTKITLPSLNARTFWNAFQSFLSSNLLDIMTV